MLRSQIHSTPYCVSWWYLKLSQISLYEFFKCMRSFFATRVGLTNFFPLWVQISYLNVLDCIYRWISPSILLFRNSDIEAALRSMWNSDVQKIFDTFLRHFIEIIDSYGKHAATLESISKISVQIKTHHYYSP